jgi:hypothetical protein
MNRLEGTANAKEGRGMKKTILYFAFAAMAVLLGSLAFAEGCSLDVSGNAKVTPLDARLILEKIAGECPVSIRKGCDEICCDVDGDNDCDGDDADLVMARYMESTDETPSAVSLQADYLAKQYRAQQTLVDMVGRMRQYQSESGKLAETAGDLGVTFKQEALFEYQIHDGNPGTGEYQIIATSKAPGIAGNGADDEIWTVDQERRFTRLTAAISEGPRASCLHCYWDTRDMIDTMEQIADRQIGYHTEFNRFAENMVELGWTPPYYDKYSYSVIADDLTFLVTASSKAPGVMEGGAGDDVWTVDELSAIRRPIDACHCCDGRCPTEADVFLIDQIPGEPCFRGIWWQGYAKETLQKIAKNQKAYFAEFDSYTSDLQYWWDAVPFYQRYDYTVEADATSFLARATIFQPEVVDMDEWTIDQNGVLTHVQDFTTLCPGLTVQEINSEGILCDSLGEASPCHPPDEGLIPRVSVTESEMTLNLSLAPPNNLGAFGFEVLFNPEVLRFSSSSPDSLAQSMDAFEVRESEPGRLRLGGYAMNFIPKGESGPLASLFFQVLTDGPLELDFINLTDHMNPWAERQISIPALSERNDLAEAIRILKILAGLTVDRDLYAPDVDGDAVKGLPEVVYLLQTVSNIR